MVTLASRPSEPATAGTEVEVEDLDRQTRQWPTTGFVGGDARVADRCTTRALARSAGHDVRTNWRHKSLMSSCPAQPDCRADIGHHYLSKIEGRTYDSSPSTPLLSRRPVSIGNSRRNQWQNNFLEGHFRHPPRHRV